VTDKHPPVLGIVVGGGPAPGINGVIAAATIEARNHGIEVVGILDGFRWLSSRDVDHVERLEIRDVSRIHFSGGSVLRTARVNPTKSPELLENVMQSLDALHIRWLVTIGGDDTAFTASRLAKARDGRLGVAHVPKTIDNDLPLPGHVPTFGFETARHYGASIVARMMEDAHTTSRWYLLVAMGRKAGHLALGVGKAASATLTLIAEEFGGEKLKLDTIADVIEGSVIRRRAVGQEHGVVVLAEGLAEKLDPADLNELAQVDRDDHGHMRLAELPLGPVLRRILEGRFGARGAELKIVTKNIGYELRCADPIPFDAEYTRDLGYGAARFLLGGGTEAMITRQGGQIVPIPLLELMDPDTGRMRVRWVDTKLDSYEVARSFMVRLEPSNLEDPQQAEALARAGATTVEDLRRRFG
jgi:6-phosphofructokinase 1